MSCKQTTETTWEITLAAGDCNTDAEIKATAPGLEVAGDLITWDDLQRAREAAASADARQNYLKAVFA